jgi:hypothetical protein
MQLKMIPRKHAQRIASSEALVLQSFTVERNRVHLAEHAGQDILLIIPHGCTDAFLVGNSDADHAHGHGYNMHMQYRETCDVEGAKAGGGSLAHE